MNRNNENSKSEIARILVGAAGNNELELVKDILHNNPNLIDVKHPETGRTPLVEALLGNHIDVVKELLKNKDIDVNMMVNTDVKKDFRATPLFAAIYKCKTKLVKLLLDDNRLDVNKSDSYGRSAITSAIHNECKDIIDDLLKQDNIKLETEDKHGWFPLLLASIFGQLDLVKKLCNAGANVNKQNKNGDTSLMIACIQANVNIVEYLLDNGANKELKNNSGENALDITIDVLNKNNNRETKENLKKIIILLTPNKNNNNNKKTRNSNKNNNNNKKTRNSNKNNNNNNKKPFKYNKPKRAEFEPIPVYK